MTEEDAIRFILEASDLKEKIVKALKYRDKNNEISQLALSMAWVEFLHELEYSRENFVEVCKDLTFMFPLESK